MCFVVVVVVVDCVRFFSFSFSSSFFFLSFSCALNGCLFSFLLGQYVWGGGGVRACVCACVRACL